MGGGKNGPDRVEGNGQCKWTWHKEWQDRRTRDGMETMGKRVVMNKIVRADAV